MPSSEPPALESRASPAQPLFFSAGGQVNTWVARAKDGKAALYTYLWGLVPYWSKDPKKGARLVNAKAETPTKDRCSGS
jgi:putative SOS response-associated peptidase YedK